MSVDSRLPLLTVGGSAGSLPPLLDLVGGLPADLPAAVLVTVHVGEHHPSRLAEVLQRHTALEVGWAQDGEPMRPGTLRVAPPGRHLLALGAGLSLSTGPRVNRHRPSVDVLFASAAYTAGQGAIGVVLSGVLDDGAVGSALVARAGGQVLAQDPAEADFPPMPAAALAAAPGARSARRAVLGSAASSAVREAANRLARAPRTTLEEASMSMADSDDPSFLFEGETGLTRLVCPECHGAMARVDLPQITYFRCHVGHQYAPQTLAASQAETSEAKLWTAVAALEEQAVVARYLRSTGGDGSAEVPEPDQLSERADSLRQLVREWTTQPDPDPPQEVTSG